MKQDKIQIGEPFAHLTPEQKELVAKRLYEVFATHNKQEKQAPKLNKFQRGVLSIVHKILRV